MNYNKLFHIFNNGLGKDFIWTFFGQVIVLITLFVSNKILSNLWSTDDFGLYNVYKRSASVLSFVMLGGLGIALPRYISINQAQKKFWALNNQLYASLKYFSLVTVVTFTLVLCFFKWLKPFILPEQSYWECILLLFYSFVGAAVAFAFAYLRGMNLFKVFNINQIIYYLLMLFFTFFVFFHLSVSEMYLIWALSGFTILLIWFYRELFKSHWHLFKLKNSSLVKSYFKELSGYSLPRLFSDLLLFSLSSFPVLYISYKLSLEATALYSVGISLVTMVSPMFSVLGTVLLPYVSKYIALGEFEQTKKIMFKLSILYIALAILLTLIVYPIVPFLIKLFFAEKYLASTEITQIMLISILPSALYLLYRNPIDAISKHPFNLYILLVSFIILFVAFLSADNLSEFSWAYLIASVTQGILSFLTWIYLQFKKI